MPSKALAGDRATPQAGWGLKAGAWFAVLFLNHFNKRVRLALHQMDLLKVMLINRFYGGGSSHQGIPVREAHAGKVTELKAGKGQ